MKLRIRTASWNEPHTILIKEEKKACTVIDHATITKTGIVHEQTNLPFCPYCLLCVNAVDIQKFLTGKLTSLTSRPFTDSIFHAFNHTIQRFDFDPNTRVKIVECANDTYSKIESILASEPREVFLKTKEILEDSIFEKLTWEILSKALRYHFGLGQIRSYPTQKLPDLLTRQWTEEKAKETGILPVSLIKQRDGFILDTVLFQIPHNHDFELYLRTVSELQNFATVHLLSPGESVNEVVERIIHTAYRGTERAVTRFVIKKRGTEKRINLINTTENPFTASDPKSILYHLIGEANREGATDIHIEPINGGRGTIIYYRIGTERMEKYRLSESELYANISHIARTLFRETRNRQESVRLMKPVSGSIEEPNTGVRCRVEVTPTHTGEVTTLRILRSDVIRLSPRELGLIGPSWEMLIQGIKDESGLIVISGRTGSGKNTTIFKLLEKIDRAKNKVWSVENPVEYVLEGLCQVEVNQELGFADALRSFLRSDPDIIYVAECRDDETANVAIEAALTGHLVLTTVHANDPVDVIDRFTGRTLSVDPGKLIGSINLLAHQYLIPRPCPSCSEFRYLTEVLSAVAKEIRGFMDEYPDYKNRIELDRWKIMVRIGNGCPNCKNGFRGVTPILSVLKFDRAIKNAFYEHYCNRSMDRNDLIDLLLHSGNWVTRFEDIFYKSVHGLIGENIQSILMTEANRLRRRQIPVSHM